MYREASLNRKNSKHSMFTYAEIFAEGFATSGIHRATKRSKGKNAVDRFQFHNPPEALPCLLLRFLDDYLRREYALPKVI